MADNIYTAEEMQKADGIFNTISNAAIGDNVKEKLRAALRHVKDGAVVNNGDLQSAEKINGKIKGYWDIGGDKIATTVLDLQSGNLDTKGVVTKDDISFIESMNKRAHDAVSGAGSWTHKLENVHIKAQSKAFSEGHQNTLDYIKNNPEETGADYDKIKTALNELKGVNPRDNSIIERHRFDPSEWNKVLGNLQEARAEIVKCDRVYGGDQLLKNFDKLTAIVAEDFERMGAKGAIRACS